MDKKHRVKGRELLKTGVHALEKYNNQSYIIATTIDARTNEFMFYFNAKTHRKTVQTFVILTNK